MVLKQCEDYTEIREDVRGGWIRVDNREDLYDSKQPPVDTPVKFISIKGELNRYLDWRLNAQLPTNTTAAATLGLRIPGHSERAPYELSSIIDRRPI